MIWNPFKKKEKPQDEKQEQSSSIADKLEKELDALPAVFKAKLKDPAVKERFMNIARRMEADGVNFKSIRQMKKWMKDHEQELRAEGAPEQQHVETVVHEGPRIGRNDPCPCGSGKKYKKCCGAGK
jgi:uncharacterized protein YchJ